MLESIQKALDDRIFASGICIDLEKVSNAGVNTNLTRNPESFYFTHDTCLLNIKDSIKKTNKVVNKDLKFLIRLLHANKDYPNVAKTEAFVSRRKQKQFDFDLNSKLCGTKLQALNYVKAITFKSVHYFFPGLFIPNFYVFVLYGVRV